MGSTDTPIYDGMHQAAINAECWAIISDLNSTDKGPAPCSLPLVDVSGEPYTHRCVMCFDTIHEDKIGTERELQCVATFGGHAWTPVAS